MTSPARPGITCMSHVLPAPPKKLTTGGLRAACSEHVPPAGKGAQSGGSKGRGMWLSRCLVGLGRPWRLRLYETGGLDYDSTHDLHPFWPSWWSRGDAVCPQCSMSTATSNKHQVIEQIALTVATSGAGGPTVSPDNPSLSVLLSFVLNDHVHPRTTAAAATASATAHTTTTWTDILTGLTDKKMAWARMATE